MTTLPRRLEEAGLTEVLCRVAYRLVQLEARRHPGSFQPYPPKRVYELSKQYRDEGFVNIGWTLDGCARWLAGGYTMRAWRNDAPTAIGVRAFHKRAPRRR